MNLLLDHGINLWILVLVYCIFCFGVCLFFLEKTRVHALPIYICLWLTVLNIWENIVKYMWINIDLLKKNNLFRFKRTDNIHYHVNIIHFTGGGFWNLFPFLEGNPDALSTFPPLYQNHCNFNLSTTIKITRIPTIKTLINNKPIPYTHWNFNNLKIKI